MLALRITPSTCQKCARVSSTDRRIAANTLRRSRITTGIATENSACAANEPDEAQRDAEQLARSRRAAATPITARKRRAAVRAAWPGGSA